MSINISHLFTSFLLATLSINALADRDGGRELPADKVLINALIYTVDDNNPWAEAIAVNGDTITYVGSAEGANNYIGSNTLVSDLQGKFLLPGFVDSHSHIFLAGAHIDDLVLDQFDTVEGWLRDIASFAAEHPERDVIVGSGFLASSFGIDGPTRQQLDSVVPDRPVLIMDEGQHGAWLNSAALDALGIDADTPDPKPGFDYYKRDKSGNPTGYLLEGTVWQALEDLKVSTTESITAGSARIINLYNRYGITAVFDAGPWEAEDIQLEILDALVASNQLSIRFVGSHYIDDAADMDTVVAKVIALKHQTRTKPYQVTTLKIMVDGTLEGRTAAMFQDYQGDPGNRGETVFNVTQLNELVAGGTAENLDIHFHALGERAVTESLDAIALAKQLNPDSSSRFTLSHIQLMSSEDIARFAELGVMAQGTPLWAKHDAEGRELITEDQFNRYYMFNSLDKAGVKLTFGSDYPSSGDGPVSVSPMYNIEIGHTRQFPGRPDAPVQPDAGERLSLAQLIRGYTLNGAYQLRMEDKIGSIEVGKKADMVLLEQNPFETGAHDLHSVRVLRTWLGGDLVYEFDELPCVGDDCSR